MIIRLILSYSGYNLTQYNIIQEVNGRREAKCQDGSLFHTGTLLISTLHKYQHFVVGRHVDHPYQLEPLPGGFALQLLHVPDPPLAVHLPQRCVELDVALRLQHACFAVGAISDKETCDAYAYRIVVETIAHLSIVA